jgi:hypothetical protein
MLQLEGLKVWREYSWTQPRPSIRIPLYSFHPMADDGRPVAPPELQIYKSAQFILVVGGGNNASIHSVHMQSIQTMQQRSLLPGHPLLLYVHSLHFLDSSDPRDKVSYGLD